ncbi:MAG: pantetheine-phosphate adenylyltransferase [Bacteroidetes bacterium]|nr:pantetheine-phosphate adenylyltransferase [Bacteroidota bacterium]
MKKIAVFPGSFDPVTKGHESIIKRAAPLFDQIYIAIGTNTEKDSFFPIKKRLLWLKKVFADYPTIIITEYEGLTIDFCKKVGAKYILRGLRTSADFEFERSIGQINKKMYPEIETVFLLTIPEYTALNSSIVRDILRHGGNPSKFVPDEVDF